MNRLNFTKMIRSYVGNEIDRYGIVFRTKQKFYFYDSGTGKVLRCSEDVYAIFLHLFENNGEILDTFCMERETFDIATDEIKDTIAKEHILQAPKFDIGSIDKYDEKKTSIGEKCNQLIMELTENCNLRCKYCIYGEQMDSFRNFGTRKMSRRVAKAAMDYALRIADDEHMYVSYYGGEPLLCFDLIKDCTEYLCTNYRGKALDFALTTNATLVNREIAEYLAAHNFILTVSFDGAPEIHNKNRVYENGRGSFDDTIDGLHLLVDAYRGKIDMLSVNAVIDRPYDAEKFYRMEEFFEKLSWFPKELKIGTNYVDRGDRSQDVSNEKNIDVIKNIYGFSSEFETWAYNKLIKDGNIYLSDVLTQRLLDVHNRFLSDKPMTKIRFNACCVPGTRRLYVTTQGDIKTCERIGESPALGSVFDGIQKDVVTETYFDEYWSHSLENCSSCWAVHMCSVCYASCFTEKGIDMEKKKMACAACRYTMLQSLIAYHEMLEENPVLLEEICSTKNS